MTMHVRPCEADKERVLIGYFTGPKGENLHVVAIMHEDEFHDLFGKDAYDRVRERGMVNYSMELEEVEA